MERYAVIIGIDNYKSEKILPLSYAVNDAEEINKVLSNESSCGIPGNHITLLRNHEATYDNIIGAIESISEKSTKNDLVIFYFAGHGYSVVDMKQGDKDDRRMKYLLPYDAFSIKDKAKKEIDFNILKYKLETIEANNLLMFFDCCYSGTLGGRTVPISNKRDHTPANIGSNYLNSLVGKGAGRVTFTACTGNQLATEDESYEHGVFTYYLLKGLLGDGDILTDGFVDIDELWLYIRNSMAHDINCKQTPIRAGWVEGTLYLNHLIKETPQMENADEIAKRIQKKFGIKKIFISEKDDISSMGRVASEYLKGQLNANSKISVSCGSTLIATISDLPQLDLFNMEIYPLNGSPNDVIHITDSMVLSILLWSRFKPDESNTASIVPTGVPPEIFKEVDKEIREIADNVLEKAKNSDIFLFGIGNPSEKNRNIKHIREQAGLTAKDYQDVGAVGEINYLLYDENGELLSLKENLTQHQKEIIKRHNKQFFSLKPKDLRDITCRPGVELIAVAGGESKRDAILAGIKGKLVTTLITDLNTAHWIATKDEDYCAPDMQK